MKESEEPYKSKSKNLKGKEDEVISLYLSFLSILELSKRFNTSESSISNLLKKRGIKLRTRKEARNSKEYNLKFRKTREKIKDPTEVKKIIDLYNAGYSRLEISTMFDVNNVSIGNILKRNGVKLRSIQETNSHHHVLQRKREIFKEKYGVCNPAKLPEIVKN